MSEQFDTMSDGSPRMPDFTQAEWKRIATQLAESGDPKPWKKEQWAKAKREWFYHWEKDRFVISEPGEVGSKAVAVTAGAYYKDESVARLLASALVLAAENEVLRGALADIRAGYELTDERWEEVDRILEGVK